MVAVSGIFHTIPPFPGATGSIAHASASCGPRAIGCMTIRERVLGNVADAVGSIKREGSTP
jgi:hypothetical protein